MARPPLPEGERRSYIGLRLKPSALDHIDKLAADEGKTRSEMIRTLLAEAVAARAKRRR